MTRSPRTDDDTEEFSAGSVDAALRAARAAHGRDVDVVRAVKVVAGVRGLLGQARYCVYVRPPRAPRLTTTRVEVVAPPTADDPLRSALDELLDAADESERDAEPDAGWSWGQQQEVDRLLADLGARVGGVPGPHPAPELVEHGDAGPVTDLPELPDTGPGWDRDELRRLGVPAQVLSRLPVEDPSDDAGWRRALLTAIAATVPAPAPPDAQHPVVVSGYGLLGAVAVLRAAVEDGATPGLLVSDGRQRPATPAALVEVLAAEARS